MNKKHLTQSIFFSMTFSLLFVACVSETNNNRSENSETEDTVDIQEKEPKEVEQIKKIFFSLPSPIELTYLFKKEGINYQADKLHSIAARNNYNLTTKKALNLGIYGADLSYAALFGQHEDAIEYYTTCQILAEEIGIGQTFKKEFIPLFNRSKHTGNFKLFYAFEDLGLDVNLRLRYRGKYWFSDTNVNNRNESNEYAEDHFIINTSLGKQLGDRFKLRAGINNLGNYQNEILLPSNSGITFYTQLNINIY
jgi:hypothetical protein